MLLIALYALSYFVPFYLSATTRPSPTLSRDAPSVVRGRIRSVTLSCLVCTAVTFVLLTRAWPGVPGSGPDVGGPPRPPAATPREALHLLGLWPPALRDAGRALLLTALLFLGPLFSYFVVERGWADWARLAPLREVCTEWTAWRNIVAVSIPGAPGSFIPLLLFFFPFHFSSRPSPPAHAIITH
jgi:prenyl protein peptidase